jgi:hypothetical protein
LKLAVEKGFVDVIDALALHGVDMNAVDKV